MSRIFIVWVAIEMATLPAFSQKHDYIWPFGTNGGAFDTLWGGGYLDFNASPIQTVRVDTQSIRLFEETTAAISSGDGQLLLTSNGCSIVNHDQKIIDGGQSFSMDDDPVIKKYCNTLSEGTVRISTFCFLPPFKVDSSYLFVYFSEAYTPSQYPLISWCRSVDLAYIDTKSDPGKIVKRQKLYLDTLSCGILSCVRHSNNVDWWIITQKQNSNIYVKTLIKADGSFVSFQQHIGDTLSRNNDYGSRFSMDGRYFAVANKKSGVFLYNFDRSTGELSNFKNIQIQTPDTTDAGWPVSVAFSPNSKFLYTCSFEYLYQFETESQNIDSSKILIAIYDGFKTGTFQWHSFYTMQNGPDCRIYMTAPQTGRYYHVIHKPDLKGKDCDFRQHDLLLPVHRSSNIPYFPSYRLGTGEPLCDSSITVSVHQIPVNAHTHVLLNVFPNPANETAHIELGNYLAFSNYQIRILNLQGQQLYSNALHNGQSDVDVSSFPPGIVFVQLWLNGRMLEVRKLVVLH